MRNLDFPKYLALDPIKTLQTAFGDARLLTDAEKTSLKAAFGNYGANRGLAHLITPDPMFSGDLGDDFRKAYNQTYDEKRLEKLRVQLQALAENRCPRCGGARPGQVDHHLPKKTFAEFSVFTRNLLACCGECNGKKSSTVASQMEEEFLHPYLDRIPDVQFIKVMLSWRRGTVNAVVSFDDNAPINDPVLKARMKHQFTTIDVQARIKWEIGEFIRDKAASLRVDHTNSDSATIARVLLEFASNADNMFWVGSWQSAVLRKLASNARFCDGGWKSSLPKPRKNAAVEG